MQTGLKTVVVGKRGIGHRPSSFGVAIALALALLVAILSTAQGAVARSQAASTKKPSVTAMNRYEKQLAAAINATRKRHGLRALKLRAGLMRSADKHSLQMAVNGYFAHSSPNGASFFSRVRNFYGGSHPRYFAAGENILWAQPRATPRGVVKRWLASPEHRRVMLSSHWRVFGVGVVRSIHGAGIYGGHTVVLVTADFAVKR